MIIPDNLRKYLDSIDSPIPPKIYKARQLSKDGAQEIISLYASSINPVSVFKSVGYKYAYISEKNINLAFDVLMLWDNDILATNECYNNAGSPTWGMRFNPVEMFDHIKGNLDNIEENYLKIGMNVNFKIFTGNYTIKDKI